MFSCFGKKSNEMIKSYDSNINESNESNESNNKIKSTKTKPSKTKSTKLNKKKISSTLKRLVWNTNIGEEIGKTKCLCCKSTDITQMSFHCGHVVAEANGGELIVSNLKPICQNCNSSMGTKNMNDFMDTFK